MAPRVGARDSFGPEGHSWQPVGHLRRHHDNMSRQWNYHLSEGHICAYTCSVPAPKYPPLLVFNSEVTLQIALISVQIVPSGDAVVGETF